MVISDLSNTMGTIITLVLLILQALYKQVKASQLRMRKNEEPDFRLTLQVGDIHVRVHYSNTKPSNELIIIYKKQSDITTINKDNVSE